MIRLADQALMDVRGDLIEHHRADVDDTVPPSALIACLLAHAEYEGWDFDAAVAVAREHGTRTAEQIAAAKDADKLVYECADCHRRVELDPPGFMDRHGLCSHCTKYPSGPFVPLHLLGTKAELESECPGHPCEDDAERHPHAAIGEVFYCDGSCQR